MGLSDAAGEDRGLFTVMIIALFAFVALLLLGAILIALAAAMLFLFAGAGIFSVAVLIAWYHRSLKKGAQWLLYLSCTAIAGFIACSGSLLHHMVAPALYGLGTILMAVVPASMLAGFYFRKNDMVPLGRISRNYHTRSL